MAKEYLGVSRNVQGTPEGSLRPRLWCPWEGRGSSDSPALTLHSWSGSHLRWGQPLRIRHVTTGRYLALTEDQGLVVVDASKAHTKATSFCFRISKVCRGQGALSHLALIATPASTPQSLRGSSIKHIGRGG